MLGLPLALLLKLLICLKALMLFTSSSFRFKIKLSLFAFFLFEFKLEEKFVSCLNSSVLSKSFRMLILSAKSSTILAYLSLSCGSFASSMLLTSLRLFSSLVSFCLSSLPMVFNCLKLFLVCVLSWLS